MTYPALWECEYQVKGTGFGASTVYITTIVPFGWEAAYVERWVWEEKASQKTWISKILNWCVCLFFYCSVIFLVWGEHFTMKKYKEIHFYKYKEIHFYKYVLDFHWDKSYCAKLEL